jgi:hypothetical protein
MAKFGFCASSSAALPRIACLRSWRAGFSGGRAAVLCLSDVQDDVCWLLSRVGSGKVPESYPTRVESLRAPVPGEVVGGLTTGRRQPGSRLRLILWLVGSQTRRRFCHPGFVSSPASIGHASSTRLGFIGRKGCSGSLRSGIGFGSGSTFRADSFVPDLLRGWARHQTLSGAGSARVSQEQSLPGAEPPGSRADCESKGILSQKCS